jgi:dTDP-4-dehydrorhamnose 3,5-epimerase
VKLTELPIPGAWRIDADRHDDERGYFARIWTAQELGAHGIAFKSAETSLSFNARERTLRGLHYQAAPDEEAKLVTCASGRVWDVVVDLRVGSPTFKAWHGQELDAREPVTIYVPRGCAHGFMTLTAGTMLLYEISAPYVASSSRGVRWDDPALAIEWPAEPAVISERDRTFPDFEA